MIPDEFWASDSGATAQLDDGPGLHAVTADIVSGRVRDGDLPACRRSLRL